MPICLRTLAIVLSAALSAAPVLCQPATTIHAKRVDAVREFQRFFRKYKQLAQKVEAVLALDEADCPEAVHALTPLLNYKAREVRMAARKVLSGYREAETFDAVLEELVEMPNRDMRAGLIDVISEAGQPKLKKAIAQIWEAEATRLSVPEKFQIAKALGRLGAEGYEPILEALLKDPAYEVRVSALRAIEQTGLKKLGDKVVARLDDRVWQVQAAAISCVGRLRPRSAVLPLIEFLKKDGRLQKDASDALFLVTTRDFGTDYKMWKSQWKMLTGLPNFRLPTDAEVAKAKAARAKANKQYKPGKKGTAFAGIPTTSTRVIFIIDVSASMDDLVTERKKFRDGGYPSFRKIDIVRTELLNTINSLDGTTYFNVVAFAKKVKPWKRWLTKGTILNKTSALSWTKRLEPLGVVKAGGFGVSTEDDSGKTNTYAALMTAFDLDPAKGLVITGRGDKKPPKLDTIYFLTDGRPSIGKFTDTDDILREVKKINEVRGVVIHTISIGEFDASFMKRLASQNGGVFVNLGG